MAVTGAPHKSDPHETMHRLTAYSGLITWVLGGLFAFLVIAVVVILVHKYLRESREDQTRAAWDQVHLGLKGKGETPRERIPALEGVWDKVSGSEAQPDVAVKLAQAHFELAQDMQRSEADRRQSLNKARDLYDLVRKEWGDNLGYGPVAYEGAALCREQADDLDGAIEVLKEAIGKFEKHTFIQRLSYELGREYWLRALRVEAQGKDGSADRREASVQLGRAVPELADTAKAEPNTWQAEARFLKAVLEKPGPALKVFPGGVPPGPEAQVEPKKEGPAKAAEPKASEAKKEAPKVEPAPKAEAKPDAPKKAEPEAGEAAKTAPPAEPADKKTAPAP